MLEKQVKTTKNLTVREIIKQAHKCGRPTRRNCWRNHFIVEHGMDWKEYRELEKEVLS
jgi:hypothetical protein